MMMFKTETAGENCNGNTYSVLRCDICWRKVHVSTYICLFLDCHVPENSVHLGCDSVSRGNQILMLRYPGILFCKGQ